MTLHDARLQSRMPSAAPLVMPTQDLKKQFTDPKAIHPNPVAHTGRFRVATFLPAVATTLALVAIFTDWFRKDGFVAAELLMLLLVGFSAFWISLSVSASTIGLFFARQQKRAPQSNLKAATQVALLVPIYNEDPFAVFSIIRAMRDDLASTPTNHKFAIFVLSDTRDDKLAEIEQKLFDQLSVELQSGHPVYYRRRQNNTERKTGNIRDWIENWGGAWSTFIVLDADSLMSGRTITRLADELVHRPETALIQTVPHLIGANTIFSRVQQFANNIYGGVLARGLERWSGHEGNYWGHNAIVRTKAFAACAGLPKIKGQGALGGTIKSHDFVEAALLRRAGWSVRLMPVLDDSYEETPQTLVDYVLRDRRWCQGNLQHLRLLFTKGLAPASRFHMLQGAMAYVASVVWFLLLIVWALMGRSDEQHVFRYFTDANPLFPQWPEMDAVSRIVVLGFMFGLLLLPKFFGIARTIWNDPSATKTGGHLTFAVSCFAEIVLSFALAPIMMVQHVMAVMRTICGLDTGWAPQNRSGTTRSWSELLRFHGAETLVGLLLVTGLCLGVVSLWLIPIAISLLLAVPISHSSGIALPNFGFLARILETQEARTPSKILISAQRIATSST